MPTWSSSRRRASRAARPGTASSIASARAFWAAVQVRTSSDSPSSSHRYGSATSTPWSVSTTSSRRVVISTGAFGGGVPVCASAACRDGLRPSMPLPPTAASFAPAHRAYRRVSCACTQHVPAGRCAGRSCGLLGRIVSLTAAPPLLIAESECGVRDDSGADLEALDGVMEMGTSPP